MTTPEEAARDSAPPDIDIVEQRRTAMIESNRRILTVADDDTIETDSTVLLDRLLEAAVYYDTASGIYRAPAKAALDVSYAVIKARLEALQIFVKQWNACGPNSDFGRYFSNVRDAAIAAAKPPDEYRA